MPLVTVYKTLLMVGYQKALGSFSGKGQLVSAAIGTPSQPDNWTDIRMGDGEGEYLHGRTKKPMCWWYSAQWLAAGDLIKISTRVGIVGYGPDENATMDLVFSVDPSSSPVQVMWKGVGYKGYPIAKGYLREISRVSLENQRVLHKLEPFMELEVRQEERGAS